MALPALIAVLGKVIGGVAAKAGGAAVAGKAAGGAVAGKAAGGGGFLSKIAGSAGSMGGGKGGAQKKKKDPFAGIPG
jgi:hypothetical protein